VGGTTASGSARALEAAKAADIQEAAVPAGTAVVLRVAAVPLLDTGFPVGTAADDESGVGEVEEEDVSVV
jgi:hypothetical protein